MRHQKQVLQAQVAVRDPVLFQMLQAVAELQQEEADAPLVDLRLLFMEDRPLPNKVGSRLMRNVGSDDHHPLSISVLHRG